MGTHPTPGSHRRISSVQADFTRKDLYIFLGTTREWHGHGNTHLSRSARFTHITVRSWTCYSQSTTHYLCQIADLSACKETFRKNRVFPLQRLRTRAVLQPQSIEGSRHLLLCRSTTDQIFALSIHLDATKFFANFSFCQLQDLTRKIFSVRAENRKNSRLFACEKSCAGVH